MPIIHPIIDVVQPNSRVDLFQRPPDDHCSVTRRPVQKIRIMDDRRGKMTTGLNKGTEYMAMSDVVNMLQNLDHSGVRGLALVRDDSRGDVPCYRIVPLPEDMQSCGIAPPLSRPKSSCRDSEHVNMHSAFMDANDYGWDVLHQLPKFCLREAPATRPGMKELLIEHRLFHRGFIRITRGHTPDVLVSDVFKGLGEAFKDLDRKGKLDADKDYIFDDLQPLESNCFKLILQKVEVRSLSTRVPRHTSDHSRQRSSQVLTVWSPSSGKYKRSQFQIGYGCSKSPLEGYSDDESEEDEPRDRGGWVRRGDRTPPVQPLSRRRYRGNQNH